MKVGGGVILMQTDDGKKRGQDPLTSWHKNYARPFQQKILVEVLNVTFDQSTFFNNFCYQKDWG